MPPIDPEHYLRERYHGERERSALLSAYYRVKPFMPRQLQLGLRRVYARRQARTEFPRWPIESILVDHEHAVLRERMRAEGAERVPIVGFWPEGRRFAANITHDVEGVAGVRNIRRVLEIERRHGFVSSWNFVAEWYPIEDGIFDHIRAMGGEIGLHAIKHDCKLFESRASFEAELPAIHRYLREWDAVGFRSPATHRNPDWMPELGCLYDSSFPDTDPFEPQPGGCCSIFPFFLGDLVELPLTLVQDHTLFEILRADSIALWTDKSDWIIANHGLITLNTHPDYLDTPRRLRLYEEYLAYLAAQQGGWLALPRDVAEWWRTRAELRCVESDGEVHVVGPGAERATVAWAHADGDDAVAFEIEPAVAGAIAAEKDPAAQPVS
jgi:peptidoglycan/xylan/chitin deacetylase (PgdA/CDA1 family)